MARLPGFDKRAPRIDVRRPAVIINSDGVEFAVVLLNVSSAGFRLTTLGDSFHPGELVTMRVARQEELKAQIRWSLGADAGGVFLTAANPSSFG